MPLECGLLLHRGCLEVWSSAACMVVQVLGQRLHQGQQAGEGGFILDGFPRWAAQHTTAQLSTACCDACHVAARSMPYPVLGLWPFCSLQTHPGFEACAGGKQLRTAQHAQHTLRRAEPLHAQRGNCHSTLYTVSCAKGTWAAHMAVHSLDQPE